MIITGATAKVLQRLIKVRDEVLGAKIAFQKCFYSLFVVSLFLQNGKRSSRHQTRTQREDFGG